MKRATFLLLLLSLLDPVVRLDHAVRDAVQQARRPALEAPMRAVSDAGRPATVFAGILLVAFVDDVAGLTTARALVLTLAPVNLAVEGLKRAIGRTRPDGDSRRRNSSFPSSHVANAVAVAWILSRRWPRARLVWLFLAAVVAFSRMYLDRHYLSDVVAATVLGAGFATLVMRFVPWLDPKRAAHVNSSSGEARIRDSG